MPWTEWYSSLAKPSWTPAPTTIGMIWQILYPIILVSFGFVFVQMFRGKVGWLVALPFAINLVANLIFTPIQFGMGNLPLGCRGSSALLYLGHAGDRAATLDYGDELGEIIILGLSQTTITEVMASGLADSILDTITDN